MKQVSYAIDKPTELDETTKESIYIEFRLRKSYSLDHDSSSQIILTHFMSGFTETVLRKCLNNVLRFRLCN